MTDTTLEDTVPITLESTEVPQPNLQVRNRRKRYLDFHPEYLDQPNLELAEPLLYDRLIRRFQTAAEREDEGRKKGFSGIMEADILRSEAKVEALAHPDPTLLFSYKRGPDGQIVAEEKGDVPLTKDEGQDRWRETMRWRFLKGNDDEFDYSTIDENETFDDTVQERRDAEDRYFDDEEPTWVVEGETPKATPPSLTGQTGIQDF